MGRDMTCDCDACDPKVTCCTFRGPCAFISFPKVRIRRILDTARSPEVVADVVLDDDDSLENRPRRLATQGQTRQWMVAHWLAEPLDDHLGCRRPIVLSSNLETRDGCRGQRMRGQTYWLSPLGFADEAENGACSVRMHRLDACAMSIASPAGRAARGRHDGQGGRQP